MPSSSEAHRRHHIRAVIDGIVAAATVGAALFLWTERPLIALVGGAAVPVVIYCVVEISMRLVTRRTP